MALCAHRRGPVIYFSIGWLALISFLLWIGNRLLTKRLDKAMSWSRWGNVRFFTQLLSGLSYLLLLINGTYYAIKTPLTGNPPTLEQLIVANAWGIVIFVPVFSIYFSLHFLRHWRSTELEMIRYQRETIRSQLDSLKNHLDPHFLFNNLNILASLIDKDKNASKEFIHKFAEVYRSILKNKADDLILVSEEMSFIESYIYLIKTRFEENIQFNIDVRSNDKMVPPLTIQMLVENAIKHNIAPLVINITEDGDYLIVSNSLNRLASDSHGTGLSNVRKRYAHFTDKPVEVIEENKLFIVRIPLLEIEQA
ncbi:MAG: histidine kinase [Bacteroidota bacterium]